MPSLSRPACLPASPSLCLGCPRQRQRQQRHTESDRREGRDFSCACLFCLPLSSACPPLAAASLLIYKNYIHTYACACVCVCVRIYRWEFIQCATCFGPSSPFTFCFFSLLPFILRTFLCSLPFAASFTFHMALLLLLLVSLFILWSFLLCHSQSKSHASFSDSIFHISLGGGGGGSIHTNKRSLSLTHLPTLAYSLSCLSALRFGFAIQLNKNKMCVPDDDVP